LVGIAQRKPIQWREKQRERETEREREREWVSVCVCVCVCGVESTLLNGAVFCDFQLYRLVPSSHLLWVTTTSSTWLTFS
jgi:hypothetical protein